MKLMRVGEPGLERPALQLPDRRRIYASAVTRDYDEAFFANDGLRRLNEWIQTKPIAHRRWHPT